MSETITIDGPEVRFDAYLARPANPAAPAVVVMQEIFGVNADMRATCDELAMQGFLALCPDMFWRLEPGVQLSDATEQEWQKALALYTAFDIDKGVNDAAAALAHARQFEGIGRKAGIVGFCLGGLLSYRAGACMAVDAAVSFYGGGIQHHLEEARTASTPLLIHLAGDDEFIPPDAQASIQQMLGTRPEVDIHVYPGCQHAFARHGGQHRDDAASALAWQRTLAFLHRHLG